MDGEALTVCEELADAFATAVDAAGRLPDLLPRLSGADLELLLPLLDRTAALSAAGRFTVTAEAQARGEIATSQAGSVGQWVAQRCPSLDPAGAGQVAKAVRELAPVTLGPVRAAVAAGRVSVPAGLAIGSELRSMQPLLQPDAVDAVLAGLVAIGLVEGCAGVRRLRPALLARYGLGEEIDAEQDRHTGQTALSTGRDIGGGVTEYWLRLTQTARAALEAAIGPLSAPLPLDGVRDARTVEQRRGEALVGVCQRATAVAPASTPSGVKATVFVTIGWDDLRDRTRPGTLFGGLDTGAYLGPETVRKLACDGAIVPVVLGADGQILDLGRTRRLFSPGQVKALWLRDRGCTFAGCRVPAHWTDAHHVRHWSDGGATDLSNAALLCGRHHTIVHRDRLTAVVSGAGVEWNPIPGSYDRAGPDPP